MQLNRPIDLIVPVYKNAGLTKRCIDSILRNIHEINEFTPRLLLVNDSPDDKEVAALLDAYSASVSFIKVFTNKENLGFVKTVNFALNLSKKSKHDVVLVNSDTETFEGTLSNLVEVANADSQIGFVSPRSNNASFCSFPLFSPSPVLLTPDECHANWKSVAHLLPKSHITPTAVGFYMFIKYKILSNFDGLNEAFGLGYEEENDLVMRANKVGYRAALANHAFAYHAGSASFSLQGFNLSDHKKTNLKKMARAHPEFIPLVRRYESSPHFRAELLLSKMITYASLKKSVVIDLSNLGCNHNGTNELALNTILGLSKISAIELTLICPKDAFDFHGLNKLESLNRASPGEAGQYQIAIRLGQPFDLHHINVLEKLAPVNIYGMLDTIAEDCGHLSVKQDLGDYWQYIARHANGVFCISKSSEKNFVTRFPDALSLPRYAKLLPTRLACYEGSGSSKNIEHVLILGNHFPHKDSDRTADYLAHKFPSIKFVVLGGNTFSRENLQGFRSGTLEPEFVKALYARASAIVLPSYIEGFGFSVMHGLAAKKPIVARDIDATNEILSSFKSVDGVYLYGDDTECADALVLAMAKANSRVDDTGALDWDNWASGLAQFAIQLLEEDDLFTKLVGRVGAGDDLRRKLSFDSGKLTAVHAGAEKNTRYTLAELLAHEEEEFIRSVYNIILKRDPDDGGFSFYLARLRSGVSKIEILQEISESAEGKRAGTEVEGLTEAILANRRKKNFFSMATLKKLRIF